MLLDSDKFFDSVQITVAAELAATLGFPVGPSAIVCQLHSAERIFRCQWRYGLPLRGFRNSFLAGCTASRSA